MIDNMIIEGILASARDYPSGTRGICPSCRAKMTVKISVLGNTFCSLLPGQVHLTEACRCADRSKRLLRVQATNVDKFHAHFEFLPNSGPPPPGGGHTGTPGPGGRSGGSHVIETGITSLRDLVSTGVLHYSSDTVCREFYELLTAIYISDRVPIRNLRAIGRRALLVMAESFNREKKEIHFRYSNCFGESFVLVLECAQNDYFKKMIKLLFVKKSYKSGTFFIPRKHEILIYGDFATIENCQDLCRPADCPHKFADKCLGLVSTKTFDPRYQVLDPTSLLFVE